MTLNKRQFGSLALAATASALGLPSPAQAAGDAASLAKALMTVKLLLIVRNWREIQLLNLSG